MRIRPHREGDERALRNVFESAVRGLAAAYYTPEQIDAWTSRRLDPSSWRGHVRETRPFVVEIDDEVVAYADLQQSGYIDHFFVRASHARQGVGSALLGYLELNAADRGIDELYADVSLAAEAFFERHGFTVEARRQATIRGVSLSNARMRKRLPSSGPSDWQGE